MKAEDETASEGFTVTNPTLEAMVETAILEEINKLEEKTNMLKLTLLNRALQPK